MGYVLRGYALRGFVLSGYVKHSALMALSPDIVTSRVLPSLMLRGEEVVSNNVTTTKQFLTFLA